MIKISIYDHWVNRTLNSFKLDNQKILQLNLMPHTYSINPINK